jgi:hypothetical protein
MTSSGGFAAAALSAPPRSATASISYWCAQVDAQCPPKLWLVLYDQHPRHLAAGTGATSRGSPTAGATRTVMVIVSPPPGVVEASSWACMASVNPWEIARPRPRPAPAS